MKLEVDAKKVAKKILADALRQTSANGDLTNLKLLFPGCDDIPLRLAALVTDMIPSKAENYATLIERAVDDARAAFIQAMGEWQDGNIQLHEVLARYTYALFYRSSEISLWAVTLENSDVWEYPNPPFLASKYQSITGIAERSQPSESIQMKRLLQELLTDREKQMMRLELFLEKPGEEGQAL